MACTVTACINKNGSPKQYELNRIYLRLTLNRKSRYLKLDHKIQGTYWRDKENAWISSKHPLSFELNALITKRRNDLIRFITEQQWNETTLSLDSIIKAFQRGGKFSFNSYLREFVKTVKGKAYNTLKNYQVAAKHLDEYNPEIAFNDLNKDFFYRFSNWLHTAKNLKGTSVESLLKPIRVACQQARDEGLIHRNVFEGFRLSKVVKIEEPEEFYLEIDEVNKFIEYSPIDESEREVKKIFMFLCFYGHPMLDMSKLTWENVKRTEVGYVIEGHRNKNNEFYVSLIYNFPIAVEIIESQRKLNSKLVFPGLMRPQTFNRKIKKLAIKLGFDKERANKIKNYALRHTYNQICDELGIEIESLAVTMGHKKIETTRRYGKKRRKRNDVIKAFSKVSFDGIFSKTDV